MTAMPDRPTVAQILPLLHAWAEHHAALAKQMDALAKPFGGSVDGPLFDAAWLTWEACVAQARR